MPANYSEGWHAYRADAALAGGVLYPAPDALTSNNYPPLSFYVVGALGRSGIDACFDPGRHLRHVPALFRRVFGKAPGIGRAETKAASRKTAARRVGR